MQRAHCLPPAQGSVWAVRPQHVTASRHKRKALHILECTASGGEEHVVGIDLGTTNSAAAAVQNGEPRIISNAGRRTTPSVVAFQPDGQVLVGVPAQRQAGRNPNHTYYSVKRFIGKDFDDCREDRKRVAFEVMMDEDEAVVLPCPFTDEGQLYPEEISAYVLAQLLAAAELELQSGVSKAVISVPAYFSESQRQATIAAGRIAGLETVRLIREPVAAALAYGLSVTEDETVLVLDLGGGTFDVSILELGSGVVEVLSTGGDAHLGGDDWDALIVDWLIEKHLEPAGVNCSKPGIKTQLKSLAESAKVALSTAQKVKLRMPVGGPDGTPLQVVLTRAEFDKMSAPLFRRARLPIDQACWQAGVDLGTALAAHETRKGRKGRKSDDDAGLQLRPKRRSPIGEVLLVGGATRMPAFRTFVTNMTGLVPREALVDPDEAVALGAAVQAGILQGDVADVMVMDIWQASLMRAFAEQRLQDAPSAADGADEAADAAGPETSGRAGPGIEASAVLDEIAAAQAEEEWGPADLESLEQDD